MSREQMIAELCIRDEGMWLSGKVPTRFVTVGGPADKYDDAELALLVDFTKQRQTAYEARCGNAKLDWRDNFISFNKADMDQEGSWGRKRYSWREGYMHAASLPEAIATFWSDRYKDEMLGDICLLSNGEIVEITSRIPYTDGERPHDYAARRLVDDAFVGVKQHVVGGVSIHARSIEALGDSMRMAMTHRLVREVPSTAEAAARARAAITPSNDPADLTAMWEQRLLSWREVDMAARAA